MIVLPHVPRFWTAGRAPRIKTGSVCVLDGRPACGPSRGSRLGTRGSSDKTKYSSPESRAPSTESGQDSASQTRDWFANAGGSVYHSGRRCDAAATSGAFHLEARDGYERCGAWRSIAPDAVCRDVPRRTRHKAHEKSQSSRRRRRDVDQADGDRCAGRRSDDRSHRRSRERPHRAAEDRAAQPRSRHARRRDAGDGRHPDAEGDSQGVSAPAGHHVQRAHRTRRRRHARGAPPRRVRLRHQAGERHGQGRARSSGSRKT